MTHEIEYVTDPEHHTTCDLWMRDAVTRARDAGMESVILNRKEMDQYGKPSVGTVYLWLLIPDGLTVADVPEGQVAISHGMSVFLSEPDRAQWALDGMMIGTQGAEKPDHEGPLQRFVDKTRQFSEHYSVKPFNVADCGITVEEAKAMVAAVMESYPELSNWMGAVGRVREAIESGELLVKEFKPEPWAYLACGVDLAAPDTRDETVVSTFEVDGSGELQLLKVEPYSE